MSIFHVIDKNNDQLLSNSELLAYVEQQPWGPEMLQKQGFSWSDFFDEYDTDKDASIDGTEFLALYGNFIGPHIEAYSMSQTEELQQEVKTLKQRLESQVDKLKAEAATQQKASSRELSILEAELKGVIDAQSNAANSTTEVEDTEFFKGLSNGWTAFGLSKR